MARMCVLLVLLGLLQAEDIRFPAGAVIDVSAAPYLAVPDDGQDDTAALQRAITDQVSTGRFLYLPAGTYLISDSLVARDHEGQWRAMLTLQGAGRGRTILRLADRAAGFADPTHPKAMLMTGSHNSPGDGPEGGGNKAFRNHVFDMTIDAGAGNPGAIGIEWAVSNFGCIGGVDLRGDGVAGIALLRRIPGPGLIKQVTISGFAVGVDIGDIQYGVTIEDLELSGQSVAGLRIGDNLLHVRHLRSRNRVPAVLVTGRSGVLTLVDSRLEGGDPQRPAIDCNGSLLLRAVETAGYRAAAVRARGQDISGSSFAAFAAPSVAGSVPGPALLAVEETPDWHNPDPAAWQEVGPRLPGEADDTAAIQRAIDAGRATVWFRNDRIYCISDTVVIRGAVRQLHGFGSEISLGAAKAPFSDPSHPRPLFRIDPTAGEELFIDHLFPNAQYPGELIFENRSPRTVVIRHCGGWVGSGGVARSYRNTAAATGRLFIEDVFLPGWEFRGQRVWARQFNPENWEGDGSEAQVSNQGGQLWVLGFKTEGAAPFLATTARGTTELLGAYNYVSATKAETVPGASVPYPVDDATAFLAFTSENFRANDYAAYIRSARAGAVRTWSAADLPPRNGQAGDRSLCVMGWRSP